MTAIGGLAGCLGDEETDEPTESNPLEVEFFGGVFQEVLDEHLIEPFREDTGIPVESSAGTSAGEPLQLQQAVQAGEAPIDLVAASPVNRIRGERLGNWYTYEESDLPNIDNAVDDLVSYDQESGAVSGVGAYGWFGTIVSQTDLLDEEVTSWEALWEQDHTWALSESSQTTLLDITAEVFFDGAETLDTEDGLVEVMEKIQEVTDNVGVWYDGEAEAQQALLDENVEVASLFHDVTLVMEDDGAPVSTNFPEEGAVQNDANWVILESTDFPEEALEFVNYTLRPEVQQNISENLFTYPTVRDELLDMDEELQDRIFGPGVDAAIRPNHQTKIDNEEFLDETWREMVL
ncbi:ABC transporter substrate-binding protein [Natranaeroarchaeum aerophilus]|uniref:Extracellular solute-binding protein n=1 Tax=Natranaeroarchaeum aerophilus TaxID=2917711 RepID=A0AAE3FRA1_9EURY|nr:extracellular solute-binding protein [Natranaeroarchaeum aerophilus]